MSKKECPFCGGSIESSLTVCPLCNTIQSEIFVKPVKREFVSQESTKGECPACGARLDREKPFCPLCSPKNAKL